MQGKTAKSNDIKISLKEIKTTMREKIKKLEESFMNEHENGFENYFENQKEKNLKNREDYKLLEDEREKIMKDYPNVKMFLEDGEIVELSDDEKDASLKAIDIQEEMVALEHRAAFKLGFKEAYIYFEEMGMLNI